MAEDYITDGMLETFLYESSQLLEKLQELVLENQDEDYFDDGAINEIFRIMHTIKGSSGIMMYDNITKATHRLEDVFFCLRESHPPVDHEKLCELVLEVGDFVTGQLDKIQEGGEPDGDEKPIVEKVSDFLTKIKENIAGKSDKAAVKAGEILLAPPVPEVDEESASSDEPQKYYIAPVATSDSKFYHIKITYCQDTLMSNIRAYTAVFSLKEIAEDLMYIPEDIITNESSHDVIMKDGFAIALQCKESKEKVIELIDHLAGVEKIDINEVDSNEFLAGFVPEEVIEQREAEAQVPQEEKENYVIEKPKAVKKPAKAAPKDLQSYISVNIKKMDVLMDLIGELVIAEAVVLQNPDLKVPGLELANFNKAAAQLTKITGDLQDGIMRIRMIPLANTFQKMKRIVYDTSHKLGKDIELEMIGEETEVDKNIIEHISDPIMHLIRNSVDHGIEEKEDRIKNHKPEKGKITIEAKNDGDKVCIIVSDDGKGLNPDALLDKAEKNGLLTKAREAYTEKEAFNLITLPGFSTKEQVTELSGRGVGMDVVVKNIQEINGTLEIDSVQGHGSTMTIKIPLTLAIIKGIVMKVASTTFVVSTNSVKEFLQLREQTLHKQPDGGEFIMIRGDSYPVIRLKERFGMKDTPDSENAILAFIEHEDKHACILVDELLGEQEIVIKALPDYMKKVKGISGCTQLGDGSIGLIIDPGVII
jgi:two-component system chemotaxis sensor kinase CheA